MAEIKRDLGRLTKMVNTLSSLLSSNTPSPMPIKVCSLCDSPMHSAQMCISFIEYSSSIHEQAYAVNDFRQPLSNPFTQTYTQGWINYSNFV